MQRTLAKINYHIHTDAIKENLIPQEVSKRQAACIYADEADLLIRHCSDLPLKSGANVILTRDYAGLEQLVVLSNLESINALLIKQGLSQSERLIQLNKTAIAQMKTLVENRAIKRLERKKHT